MINKLVNVKDCSIDELYSSVLDVVQSKIKEVPEVSGDRTVYYMSAEFLIGKLL